MIDECKKLLEYLKGSRDAEEYSGPRPCASEANIQSVKKGV